MPNPKPSLLDFDELDGVSSQLNASEAVALDPDTLKLGPFVEALVLRKSWPSLNLAPSEEPRRRVISRAAKELSGSAFADRFGAFFIRPPSEQTDNQALAFGEELARRVGEAGLSDKARILLKGATVELVGNVGEHAGPEARGIAVFEMFAGGVCVSVADAGDGVVAAYVRADPKLVGLRAEDALEMAVVKHQSRLAASQPGRGTGFRTVASAMRSLDATLRVRSGDASLEIEGHPDDAEWLLREQIELRGFVVSLTLCWN